MRRQSSPRFAHRIPKQNGYAIILMLVLVTMGILYAVVHQASLVGMKVGRTQDTSAALLRAKEALIGYAATYRDDPPSHAADVFGYLPCPDMTAVPQAAPPQGNGVTENICGAAGETVVGLLPYRTLGLDDLRDSDGVCLWYVVSGTYKYNPKTAPLNWDTRGQIQVNDSSGNPVILPSDTNGGAAAVIIAAGPPIGGQNRTPNTSNVCGAMPAEVTAYIESTVNAAGTTTISQGVPGGSGINDQILAIIPSEIFNRIAARADFKNPLSPTPPDAPGIVNNMGDKIRAAIEAQFQNDLISGATEPNGIARPDAATGGYVPINGKLIGDPLSIPINNASWSASVATFSTPTLHRHSLAAGQVVLVSDMSPSAYNGTYTVLASGLTSNQFQVSLTSNPGLFILGGKITPTVFTPLYTNHFANWRSQYRYAACDNLSGCIDIAGDKCRGVLMFAGQSVAGPRGQIGSSPATLNNFFEGGSGLGILNSSNLTFSGHTAYSDPYNVASDRTFDVGTCIFPGDFVSFARNIADFTAGINNSGSGANTLTRTNANTVEQGSSGGSAGSGCIWDVNALQFKKSLRLYFRANFAVKGNGFTVALADGATNLAPNDGSRSSGQIMCGAATSDSLGYAGVPPAGSSAGINNPKIGVEFDSNFNSNRNDPQADHTAFLFWGDPADNVLSGSGADDATHYLGTGGTAITNASWTTSTATFTTAAPHGLASGQAALISGVTPIGYNGIYTVLASGLTGTQFQVSLPYDPGAFSSAGMVKPITAGAGPRNPRVATAIRQFSIVRARYPGVTSGNQAVITTPIPHRIVSGDTVYIYEVDDPLYNGVQQVVACSPGTTGIPSRRFCYIPTLSPSAGPYFSGVAVQGTELSAINWSGSGGGMATATSPNPLPFHSTSPSLAASVFGVAPSAFSTGSSIIAPLSSPTFSYSVPASASPGYFATESPAGMFVLRSSTTTPHNYFNYPSIPVNANVHVRLDITRSYDTVNHVAVLNMKAYIGDTFPSVAPPAHTCVVSDFQNMADDLSTLCPTRSITLQQDSIPVNAIALIANMTAPLPVPPVTTSLVTATTVSPHRLVNGAKVTLSGITPFAYNGVYTITVTGSNTFTYTLSSNPGTYISGGDIQPLTTFYLGFTNSRGSASAAEDQFVTIDQLILRGL
jgi:hypothetical protein